MRTSNRWILGASGLLVTVIGVAAVRRVLLPESGLGPGRMEGWMFLGPALVTLGLLLCWSAGTRGARARELNARAPRLFMQLGLGFLALPALTWLWDLIAPTAASSYAASFASYGLGVPGAALALTGGALWVWRSRRAAGG